VTTRPAARLMMMRMVIRRMAAILSILRNSFLAKAMPRFSPRYAPYHQGCAAAALSAILSDRKLL
jgi:hypothetical protein